LPLAGKINRIVLGCALGPCRFEERLRNLQVRRAVWRPPYRQQAIVFDLIVATRKAGGELMVHILGRLLVDLCLSGRAYRMRLAEMRLILAACEGFRG